MTEFLCSNKFVCCR